MSVQFGDHIVNLVTGEPVHKKSWYDIENELPESEAEDEEAETAEDHALVSFAGKYVGPGYGAIFSYGAKLKVNIVPLVLNVLGPWVLFCLLVGCKAGTLRHYDPFVAEFCFWGLSVYVLGQLIYVIVVEVNSLDPRWTRVAAINCLIAVVAAYAAGSVIWTSYLEPYHTLRDLKTYPNFDVSQQRGLDVQDVGAVSFKAGTIFDSSRAWHYMEKNTLYCVAPLVGRDALGNTIFPVSGAIDFFVVGVNCCSATSADFRCGASSDPRANSGLRVLNNSLIESFRLAVKGAESEYGFLTTNPIFFEWVSDPVTLSESWRRNGYLTYLLTVLVMLFVYLLVVMLSTCCFATIGRGPKFGMV